MRTQNTFVKYETLFHLTSRNQLVTYWIQNFYRNYAILLATINCLIHGAGGTTPKIIPNFINLKNIFRDGFAWRSCGYLKYLFPFNNNCLPIIFFDLP